MGRMTLREAADRAGMSVTTLRRYIRAGRLAADKRDGRFGPEYCLSIEDLAAAGLDAVPLAAPRALARRSPNGSAAALREEAAGPPGLYDVVPLGLFQELQMKHEQLLVQYGMVRAGGLRAMEQQAELEASNRELEATRDSVRRLRRDAEAQTSRLRQATLELEGRALEIEALREKVRALEMLTRNAVTTEAIDKQFRAVLDQTRRVDELASGAGPLADPPALRTETDH